MNPPLELGRREFRLTRLTRLTCGRGVMLLRKSHQHSGTDLLQDAE
jgi:hypothetical protein